MGLAARTGLASLVKVCCEPVVCLAGCEDCGSRTSENGSDSCKLHDFGVGCMRT